MLNPMVKMVKKAKNKTKTLFDDLSDNSTKSMELEFILI